MIKKLLILGSEGQLGLDLMRLESSSFRMHGADLPVDITDSKAMEALVNQTRPDWVVNAAAYTNVDQAEVETALAFRVNAEAPGLLAGICHKHSIPFVHISTDFVFSGRKTSPYLEGDPADPLGAYGRSKWEGEEQVRIWPNHYLLRTSSVYSPFKKNHATRVVEAVRAGGQVMGADDMVCSPTFTGDLANWILQLTEKQPPPGTYHLVNKGACSRYEFALTLCEKMGVPGERFVKRIQIKSLQLKAERPLRAVLSTDKWEGQVGRLRTWQEGLSSFLQIMDNR